MIQRNKKRIWDKMPTKHIPDSTWRLVEKATVRAVVETKEPIKDTDILNLLIIKGLSVVEEEDFEKLVSKESHK